MWKWKEGRQNTQYHKFQLIQIRKCFDAYLIKYPANEILPAHKDKVENGKHYRLNIELWGRGKFICENPIFKWWRIVLFRPDICEHSMINGSSSRLVLSIGWVK